MSVSSLPSSVSSSSARGTINSLTTSPSLLKTLSPNHSVSALSQIPDNDLRMKGPDELLHIIRRLESENRSLLAEHGSIIKDVNRRIQMYHLELRGLKDINQKLQDDNQELRDLCCFLDDDRQRSRKLAREWQRFGRYTASVMRSEVSSYQEKLKSLEAKQTELINENVELKELCLYLDQEREGFTQTRDEGDGSSNSTTGNEEMTPIIAVPDVDVQNRNFPDPSMQFIQKHDSHVSQLEKEKHMFAQGNGTVHDHGSKSNTGDGDMDRSNSSFMQKSPQNHSLSEKRGTPVGFNSDSSSRVPLRPPQHHPSTPQKSSTPVLLNNSTMSQESPTKPEAVVHAMKVLEVHEQLERPKTEIGGENLDDKEKAIVREMCNVVWRKLGDKGSEGSSLQANNVYENFPLPVDPPPKRVLPNTANSHRNISMKPETANHSNPQMTENFTQHAQALHHRISPPNRPSHRLLNNPQEHKSRPSSSPPKSTNNAPGYRPSTYRSSNTAPVSARSSNQSAHYRTSNNSTPVSQRSGDYPAAPHRWRENSIPRQTQTEMAPPLQQSSGMPHTRSVSQSPRPIPPRHTLEPSQRPGESDIRYGMQAHLSAPNLRDVNKHQADHQIEESRRLHQGLSSYSSSGREIRYNSQTGEGQGHSDNMSYH